MPVSEPSSGNHPLYGQCVSPREEAIEAVTRALMWQQYGLSVRLEGDAYAAFREKATLALDTIQALGWHFA